MTRMKNNWLKSLAVTLGCVIPTALTAGCASNDAPADEDVSESAATLGVEVTSCSQAGSSGFTKSSSTLALTMTGVPSLVLGVVNGYITVNGFTCVMTTMDGGTKLTPALVKKINITGTAGDDKVVIDTLSGPLGSSILSATGGIVIDLLGQTMSGADTFSLRGSSNADKWSAGVSGGDNYFEISGDTTADIRVQHAETFNISLSAGADTFSAQGGTFTATHLAGAPVTTLTPVTAALTINGGDGDDILTGGNGNDTISGGNGNDIFKAALTDGNDNYYGGAGTDKMDYSIRTNALTVVMDAAPDGSGTPTASGESGETDHIGTDVEDLVGGSGADTLTGNASSNHIQGGNGDDIISGGLNSGSCTNDVDVLDGEGGNDTFLEGSAADCGDTINGGAGKDKVDYQDRANDLSISLDGTANDGETGEKDNVKNDVEVVLGGLGNDTIIGSANNDELHGGPGNDIISGGAGNDTLTGNSGNDILNGEAGDDTFDESGVDTNYNVDGVIYMAAENKGDGNDIMNGGTHDTLGVDTVDYTSRATFVTATICVDSAHLTAGPGSSPTGNCADADGEASETDNVMNVNHLIGSANDDVLTGGSGDDTIEGLAGNDTIHGGAGNDMIYGDAGDDILFGDAGDDTLDGGAATMGDTFDGDNVTNTNDGDVCITKTGDTVVNCEL